MRMIENLAYITKMYGKLRKKLSSRTLSQSDTVLVELIIYVPISVILLFYPHEFRLFQRQLSPVRVFKI